MKAASRISHLLQFTFFYAPPTVLPYLFGPAGREYNVGFWTKFTLMRRIFGNTRDASSASTFLEQLTIAQSILSIPQQTKGSVAEFGCFKGRSSASLSLACALTGRRLIVFDSFDGLPESYTDTEIIDGGTVPFQKGQFKGMLEEVKENVRTGGDLSVCEFVKGYYDATLPDRPQDERYCMIFEDADLPSSVRTVLHYAWPRLQDGCIFFCHEARLIEIMKMFYDDAFWSATVGGRAPGLVGAGLGLTLSEIGSNLGYVTKGV